MKSESSVYFKVIRNDDARRLNVKDLLIHVIVSCCSVQTHSAAEIQSLPFRKIFFPPSYRFTLLNFYICLYKIGKELKYAVE